MQIAIITAMTKNKVIGIDHKLPWKIPAELQYFRKMTLNKPIIMGSKTFLGLGKVPLPQRYNIVLTKDPEKFAPEQLKYPNLALAFNREHSLDLAKKQIFEGKVLNEIMIIGGGEIYKLFLPLATKLYLSIIKTAYPGNVFFPEYDLARWKLQQVLEEPEFIAQVFELSL